MVIVMDMSTGKTEQPHLRADMIDAAHDPLEAATESAIEAEFGPFATEVMNAGWLPQPTARLEPLSCMPAPVESIQPGRDFDADEFLKRLYCNQE